MTVDHEMYFVECVDFAKSFIQLYLKEDDVLFKVLLHLLRVPCCAEQDEREKVALEDSNGMGGQATNQSFCKKRKVSLGGSSSWGEDSLAPTKNHLTFLDDEPDEENENGCKHTQNGGQYFKEAKECLLSLKISIEGLHQKNLFPYDPNVLLNRLTRFQELCFEEEK
ncbi:unnamed protein product [Prunus armeniaca]